MLIIFFFLAVPGSLQVCPHDAEADAVTQVHSKRNHNSRRLRGQGNGALSCSKQCCGSGGSSISSESGSGSGFRVSFLMVQSHERSMKPFTAT
jgi:hypothetical protein